MYDFSSLKNKLLDSADWLSRELSGLRTGKASPAILDNIKVDTYGQLQAIKHLANINIEDAKTLRITPWDKSSIKMIESAIMEANLGISTAPDSLGLRVIFPELSTERRQVLIKLVNEKLEEARISVKKERERTWGEIQEQNRASQISEDDKFRAKDELQKIIDQANNQLEQIAEKKINELKS